MDRKYHRNVLEIFSKTGEFIYFFHLRIIYIYIYIISRTKILRESTRLQIFRAT